jgi:hypothetical protein
MLTFDSNAYPDFVVVVVVVVVEKAVKFSVVVKMTCIFDAKSNFRIKSDSIWSINHVLIGGKILVRKQ